MHLKQERAYCKYALLFDEKGICITMIYYESNAESKKPCEFYKFRVLKIPVYSFH